MSQPRNELIIKEAKDSKEINNAQLELLKSLLSDGSEEDTEAGLLIQVIKESQTINLGTKILYLERAVSEDCYDFITSLDKFYALCSEDKNENNLELIRALKKINDLCFNNEILNDEHGTRPCLERYFTNLRTDGALSESEIAALKSHAKQMVNNTIQSLQTSKENWKSQKAKRIEQEEALEGKKKWRKQLQTLPQKQLLYRSPPSSSRAIAQALISLQLFGLTREHFIGRPWFKHKYQVVTLVHLMSHRGEGNLDAETALNELKGLESYQIKWLKEGFSRQDILTLRNRIHFKALATLGGNGLTRKHLSNQHWLKKNYQFKALIYLMKNKEMKAKEALAELKGLNARRVRWLMLGFSRKEVLAINNSIQFHALLTLRTEGLTTDHFFGQHWFKYSYQLSALMTLMGTRGMVANVAMRELKGLNATQTWWVTKGLFRADVTELENNLQLETLLKLRPLGLTRKDLIDQHWFNHPNHFAALMYLITGPHSNNLKASDAMRTLNGFNPDQAKWVTEGFSPTDIRGVTNKIQLVALRRFRAEGLTIEHFAGNHWFNHENHLSALIHLMTNKEAKETSIDTAMQKLKGLNADQIVWWMKGWVSHAEVRMITHTAQITALHNLRKYGLTAKHMAGKNWFQTDTHAIALLHLIVKYNMSPDRAMEELNGSNAVQADAMARGIPRTSALLINNAQLQALISLNQYGLRREHVVGRKWFFSENHVNQLAHLMKDSKENKLSAIMAMEKIYLNTEWQRMKEWSSPLSVSISSLSIPISPLATLNYWASQSDAVEIDLKLLTAYALDKLSDYGLQEKDLLERPWFRHPYQVRALEMLTINHRMPIATAMDELKGLNTQQTIWLVEGFSRADILALNNRAQLDALYCLGAYGLTREHFVDHSWFTHQYHVTALVYLMTSCKEKNMAANMALETLKGLEIQQIEGLMQGLSRAEVEGLNFYPIQALTKLSNHGLKNQHLADSNAWFRTEHVTALVHLMTFRGTDNMSPEEAMQELDKLSGNQAEWLSRGCSRADVIALKEYQLKALALLRRHGLTREDLISKEWFNTAQHVTALVHLMRSPEHRMKADAALGVIEGLNVEQLQHIESWQQPSTAPRLLR